MLQNMRKRLIIAAAFMMLLLMPVSAFAAPTLLKSRTLHLTDYCDGNAGFDLQKPCYVSLDMKANCDYEVELDKMNPDGYSWSGVAEFSFADLTLADGYQTYFVNEKLPAGTYTFFIPTFDETADISYRIKAYPSLAKEYRTIPATLVAYVGEELTFSIKGAETDAAVLVLSAKSSNKAVADVVKLYKQKDLTTARVRVKGIKAGKCSIVVTNRYGAKKSYPLVVKERPVTLQVKNVKVKKGKTFANSVLYAKDKVIWKSGNKAIATVTQKGVIKGLKPGTCRVTATVGTKKLVCNVTVTK